jgi:hypothetical protein
MFAKQLKDEIEMLVTKEAKIVKMKEEKPLLEKNLRLEEELHESELENRKLQLWILDDKYE